MLARKPVLVGSTVLAGKQALEHNILGLAHSKSKRLAVGMVLGMVLAHKRV